MKKFASNNPGNQGSEEALKRWLQGIEDSPELRTEKANQAKKLRVFIGRASDMVDQIQNLYNQYVAGIEKTMPIEKRRQLDYLMTAILYMPKNGPTARFQYDALHNKVQAFRDRWERLVRDLESGKVKRRAPEKRG